VRQADLYPLWHALKTQKLAAPVIGTLADMICCPGLDYCSLANASSISIANQINEKFDHLDYLYDLGELRLNMSGCMNACGHHHVGHIGILGVDKKGEEWYQISLGGCSENDVSLGDILGPSVPKTEVANTLERILRVYVERREGCMWNGARRASASSTLSGGSVWNRSGYEPIHQEATRPSRRKSAMRSVIKHRRIVEDRWQHLADGADLPAGPIIVSLARWQRERKTLLERGDPIVWSGAIQSAFGCRTPPMWPISLGICRCWRSWRWNFPSSPMAAPIRRPGCCGSATAIAAKSGRWATCCATNCFSWRAAVSTPSSCGRIAVWRMLWPHSKNLPKAISRP